MNNIKDVYKAGYGKTENFRTNNRCKKIIKILSDVEFDFLRESDSVKILDLGCGDALFTKIMADSINPKILKKKHVFGVDISSEAVEEAKKIGVIAACLDIDNDQLPFDDESFDFIYCGSLVELVLNPDNLIRELRRTLAPDGIILITHPNMGSWLSRIALLVGRLPYYYRVSTEFDLGKLFIGFNRGRSTGFIRLFTSNAMTLFIRAHNLQEIRKIGAGEDSLPVYLKFIDRLFSKIPSLAFQNILIIKKSNISKF